MTNPLDGIHTLKEGWAYFLKVFRNVIPEGEEYKFEGAFYAGAATYDSILFNKIKKAGDEQADNDTVTLNITDLIFELHKEVGRFAHKRVVSAEAAINEEHQRN